MALPIPWVTARIVHGTRCWAVTGGECLQLALGAPRIWRLASCGLGLLCPALGFGGFQGGAFGALLCFAGDALGKWYVEVIVSVWGPRIVVGGTSHKDTLCT